MDDDNSTQLTRAASSSAISADPGYSAPVMDPTAAIVRLITNISPALASLIPPVATNPIATIANVRITPLLLVTVYAAYRLVR